MQIEYLKKLYPKGYAIFLEETKLNSYTINAMDNSQCVLLFLMYLNKKGINVVIQNSIVLLLHNNENNIIQRYVQFACCVPLSGEMIRISILHTFCSNNNYMQDIVKAFEWLVSVLESPIQPILQEINVQDINNDSDLPF